MLIAIVFALAILPAVFVTIGFIAASTMLFAIVASALRATRPSARSLVGDVTVGVVFSSVLFVVFTRGLDVSLPGPAF